MTHFFQAEKRKALQILFPDDYTLLLQGNNLNIFLKGISINQILQNTMNEQKISPPSPTPSPSPTNSVTNPLHSSDVAERKSDNVALSPIISEDLKKTEDTEVNYLKKEINSLTNRIKELERELQSSRQKKLFCCF